MRESMSGKERLNVITLIRMHNIQELSQQQKYAPGEPVVNQRHNFVHSQLIMENGTWRRLTL